MSEKMAVMFKGGVSWDLGVSLALSMLLVGWCPGVRV